jgi:hypothetical protein
MEIGLSLGLIGVLQSEQASVCLIHSDVARLAVFKVDGVGHGVHEGLKKVALVGQSLLYLLTRADVPRHDHDAVRPPIRRA